jgi:hypothetical protein
MDPAEVAQGRDSGWSGTHHSDPATGVRIAGTALGLGFSVDDSWNNPVEVIPWPEVAAITATVPAELRDELSAFGARWREHQSGYPRFTASAAAIGCGPITVGGPLTPRQEAYMRELEAFDASGVLSVWEQRRVALDAERLSLHARALPLGAGSAARDLFDLLEDQQPDQTSAAVSTRIGTGQSVGDDTGGLSEERGEAGGLAHRPGLQPPTGQAPTIQPHKPASTAPGRVEVAR